MHHPLRAVLAAIAVCAAPPEVIVPDLSVVVPTIRLPVVPSALGRVQWVGNQGSQTPTVWVMFGGGAASAGNAELRKARAPRPTAIW